MKMRLKLFVVLVSLLLVMLPVCFAEQNATEENNGRQRQNAPLPNAYINFPGLASSIAALLVSAGFAYIAVGVAVVAGGYVVYRVTKYAWTYYKLYSYSKWWDHHAYAEHILDDYQFENIWGGKKPTQTQFENKCKNVMNSKSKNIRRFLQKADKRLVVYDPLLDMLVIGEKDGKTIVTCFKPDKSDFWQKKLGGKNPPWIPLK